MILAKTYMQTWAFIKKFERGNFCCIENMFTYKLRCVKGSWNNLRFFLLDRKFEELVICNERKYVRPSFPPNPCFRRVSSLYDLKLQTSKLMKLKDINVCQKLTLKVLFVKIFIINCLFHNRK